MPQAVAAVGAFVGWLGGGTLAAGIVGSALRIGAGIALSSLLAPKGRGSKGSGVRGGTFAIREPAVSRRIPYGTCRMGGIYFYAETAGAQLEDLYLVLGIGDGPIASIDKMFFDGDEIALETNGNDANGRPIYEPVSGEATQGYVTVSFYTGAASQPADAGLVAASDSKWTAAHTLDGIAYAVVKFIFNADAFPQGVPNVSFEVQGRNDIYDPRSTTTAFSANPALCLNHYLTTAKIGANATYATEINETLLMTAANVCDESVSLKAGGTESRYTVNGYIDVSDDPETIVADFKGAMAGWVVFAGGKFEIYAGAYSAPTFEIDEDMIIGPVSISNRLRKRDRVNVVGGVYQADENHFQPTDFPPATNAAYVTADGGEIRNDLELVMTTSPATAQRLAKIELESARREKTVEIQTNLKGLPCQSGKTVMLTLDRYGWARKTFLVVQSSIGDVGEGSLGLNLSLREFDADIYAWTPASDETTVSVAPALSVGPPTVANVTASPAGGAYAGGEYPKEITLSCATTDAAIRWSISAVPLTIGSGTEYLAGAKPSVNSGETLYARAFKDGYADSGPMTETYTTI